MAVSIGTVTATATYGMGTEATTARVTETLILGAGGAPGSSTVVNIGSATSAADGITAVKTPTVTIAITATQADLTAQLLVLGGASVDSYNRLSMNTPAAALN